MIFTYQNFKKILKNPAYLLTYYHIRQLYNTPRYQEKITYILGKPIRAIDSLSCVFMYKEIFEKEIYKFKSSSSSPLIIDCGANIGLSVIYFKQNYPTAKIIAFEPDQKAFLALKDNLAIFGFNDIEFYENAVWKDESSLNFLADGADGGHLVDGNNNDLIKVKTVKLSQYLKQTVDFLKIDIEGAEKIVLEESREYLKNVANIFIEYHSFFNQTQELDQILVILKSVGFRVYIEHIGIRSQFPFLKRDIFSGIDLQLNIYGYR